ncbi:L-threonylcarbamoyladenylate synthase [Brachybacterium sp. GCM10030267]|uniref:L-threonylcarbamoyladenylate synthase n=1 Tax=Brachybacterium sp. GCM10030267 TaxID=3273381 RepID=UPI00361C1F20
MSVHDTQNPETREAALTAATDAVRAGKLIVLPTDTVYGIGADAFTAESVTALLEAKGRGRDTPPPVLVGDHAVLLALAVDVPDYVERLAEEFWPGPLTLILKAQPSLTWDLGETRGTVALRMPDHEIALELLRRTGPLAVSSANRHGKPAAVTVLDAATQLGDAVEEYLDGGPARLGTSSTILDTTVEPAEIVREGALTAEQIIEVVGDIFTAPEPEPSPEEGPAADSEPTADGSEDTAAGTTAPAADSAGTELPGEDGTEGAPVTAGVVPVSADGAGSDDAAGVLDLPSEPDLVELSSESVAPDSDLAAAAGESPATEEPTTDEPATDASEGGRPAAGPGDRPENPTG